MIEPAEPDAVIAVEDLRCSYGSFEAVRGVSFEVRRGELFALLGTNGAGKTTTMETVEGHRPPTAGRVRVLGQDPYRRRRHVRRHTGVMLQESGFVGELTVAETLRMWGRLTSRPTDPDGALDLLDLRHRSDVRVAHLSGGERRRLDLAVATLGRPEILFLDEPTTGLDPESRQRVWVLVEGLVDSGTAVVLTTHYLEEAEALADRMAIMHEGRLAVMGTLSELLARDPARISFDLPEEVSSADLPILSGGIDQGALARGRVECRTRQLQGDLGLIIDWTREKHVDLRRFRAQHASLSDLFASIAHGAGSDRAPGNGHGAPAREGSEAAR